MPLVVVILISLYDEPLSDMTEFRNVIGALQPSWGLI